MDSRILITCFLLTETATPATIITPEVHVSSGVYVNTLSHVVTYETSLPTMFKVELPQINEVDKPPTCKADEYLCKLASSVYTAYKTLHADVLLHSPYMHSSTAGIIENSRSTRGLLDFMGSFYKFTFGLATMDDVNKLHASVNDVQSEMTYVQEQMKADHQNLVTMEGNLTAYSKDLQNFLRNTTAVLSDDIRKAAESALAGESLLAYGVHHLLQLVYLEHSLATVESAASDCRSGLIPRSILPSHYLKERLAILSDKMLRKHGWILAAGVHDLLMLPATKCTFTETHVFITIQLPIRRIDHDIIVHEFIAIPYQFEDKQCTLHSATKYVAQDGDRIIPITPHLFSSCNMDDSKFCLIPVATEQASIFSKCAEVILRHGTPGNITKECPLECRFGHGKPIIPISTSLYAVTNVENLTFACKKQPSRTYRAPKKVGYFTFSIPCNCTISVDDDTLEPIFPCPAANDLEREEIAQVIPLVWSHLRSAVMQDAPIKFTNLSEAFDQEWMSRIPTLNIDPPRTVAINRRLVDRIAMYIAGSGDSSNAMLIWVAALSMVVVVLVGHAFLTTCNHSSHTRGGLDNILACAPFLPAAARGAAVEERGAAEAVWDLLKNIEWVNMAGEIAICIICLIILCLIIKVLRYSRRAAECIETNLTTSMEDLAYSPRRHR